MGTATWVKSDFTTQGSWVGVYGTDGYNIFLDGLSTPAYATVTLTGNSTYNNGTTAAAKDLVRATNHAQHIQSGYYSFSNYTIDVALTSGTHQVGIYIYDFDTSGRVEKIEVLNMDSGGAVLDTRTFRNLTARPGYMFWNCSGHVALKITVLAGGNCVASGLFFDPAGTPVIAATASFVSTDTTTQGSWVGIYGADGGIAIGDTPSYPAYATVSGIGSTITFENPSLNVKALTKVSNHAQRINGIWYAGVYTTIDLTGGTHGVSVYAFDGDSSGRAEIVSIISPDDGEVVLDSQTIGSLITTPKWLNWDCSGRIGLSVTLTAGSNYCISGFFFGPQFTPATSVQPIMLVIS